jgi:hypothetical protein
MAEFIRDSGGDIFFKFFPKPQLVVVPPTRPKLERQWNMLVDKYGLELVKKYLKNVEQPSLDWLEKKGVISR